ncbi:hypothetical protein TsFJ059_002830 [Trichoderma semiorbis]|uniref:Uncharacterized protein n=1 Tax=Trichoderma semiorbis TaxID=1491008 RepID=A0A9P8HMF6_9HYPO|nr:hypothetical protein TsFJ059_002830 [Trichoderma semiorbis]
MLYGGYDTWICCELHRRWRRQKGIVCQQRAADKGTSSVRWLGIAARLSLGSLSLPSPPPPSQARPLVG